MGLKDQEHPEKCHVFDPDWQGTAELTTDISPTGTLPIVRLATMPLPVDRLQFMHRNGCSYPGPPVWLSVIGVNRFWPLAARFEPRHTK
jgi:hypothetical protein